MPSRATDGDVANHVKQLTLLIKHWEIKKGNFVSPLCLYSELCHSLLKLLSTRVAPHFNCSQISSHIETNRFCVKIYNTFEALCFCIYILQYACFELMVVCNTATITSAATNLIHTVLSYFRMLFCTACVTDTVLRSTRSSSLISSSGC